jgi:hypothetical protein
MSNVVQFKPNEYSAELFIVKTIYGDFRIAGTLCGNIDVSTPQGPTFALTVDEMTLLISALISSKEDVLSSSSPLSDSRIIDGAIE